MATGRLYAARRYNKLHSASPEFSAASRVAAQSPVQVKFGIAVIALPIWIVT